MPPLENDFNERFCEEFIIDLKGAPAIRRAGFDGKRPDQAAYELLRKPEIQDRIYELKRERANRTRITQDRVLVELARVAFADLGDVVKWSKDGVQFRKASTALSPDDRAAVRAVKEKRTLRRFGDEELETVETTITLHDKMKALELLGKHVGVLGDTSGEGMPTGAVLIGVPVARPKDHREWMELTEAHLEEARRLREAEEEENDFSQETWERG